MCIIGSRLPTCVFCTPGAKERSETLVLPFEGFTEGSREPHTSTHEYLSLLTRLLARSEGRWDTVQTRAWILALLLVTWTDNLPLRILIKKEREGGHGC